ncbi:unnamed protein product [Nippostrongylus brasiliensis]|uniref:Proton_antipo_M domain-containing protein n=1 Tax=Nippostrongylus brasiliensis TaxID=27835 RepID=A0A0N4Y3V6_NIPBR|nr:unnamed protein product [Nippostrongylus brasiliensis]
MILTAVTCKFQNYSKPSAAHIRLSLLSLSLILISRKVGGLTTKLEQIYTSTFSSRILYGIIFPLVFFFLNRGVPPSLTFLVEFSAEGLPSYFS